jgi:hypothetical protein
MKKRGPEGAKGEIGFDYSEVLITEWNELK